MKEFSHIGFVGFGLIGGSIAKNIRKLYPEITITAYYYNKEHINPSLTLAKEDGTIDNIVTSFEDNFGYQA